ncbi:DUF3168 domain-containing protein [Erythrobacter sp. NE805]|uniref:tail completion protein gp17 n=1 Tax=Erythrobacter sp. NE805 TaxID=3389875 RepID=UPI00396B46B3
MSTWRQDLLARLRETEALAAVFGTRIAWFEASRSWEAFPRLVLQEISPGREYTHDGPDGLDGPRVQFDIYAETDAGLLAGETALIAAMETTADKGGTRFGMGFLEARSSPEPGDLANDRRILRLSLDFTFYHEAL